MNRALVVIVGICAWALAFPALAQSGGAQPSSPAGSAPTTQPAGGAQPPASNPAKPAVAPGQAAPQEKPAVSEADFEYVKMSTSKGDIYLELNRAKAPITVANFLSYVDQGFYSDTIFHRVIDKFMIQGGGFDKDMKEKSTGKAIKNEWQNGLKNVRGSIAMARTPVPDSARAQFFINVADNSFLDTPRPPDIAAYCVFGRVVNGLDTVVDKIKGVKTTTKGVHQDVPVEPVVITGMARATRDEAMRGGDKK